MVFLSILWHMHQPWYINRETGNLDSPVLLFRTIFNYYPMALIASSHSRVKVCFNITPVLIEQLEAVSRGETRDDFHETLLEKEPEKEKLELLISQLPGPVLGSHRRLLLLAGKVRDNSHTVQDLFDLNVYLHLASFHPVLRDEKISGLLRKGMGFDTEDAGFLYRKESEILRNTLPLYKRLQDSGQVEISTSPFAHPIMPLVFNTDNALKTSTSMTVPGGLFSRPEDASAQLAEGINSYERVFGRRPAGIWPPEGSLDDETLKLFYSSGIRWTASDESLLSGTLNRQSQGLHYSIWDFRDGLSIFFRDHGLSDLIGFAYQHTKEEEAASDFLGKIEEAGKGDEERMVAVILDGENPWDFYPEHGARFLSSLYGMIGESSRIRMLTFSEAIEEKGLHRGKLESISPGSWMGNNFDNWIGKPAANRAWEMLDRARKHAETSQGLIGEEKKKILRREILLSESSDWFWWYSLPAEAKIKKRFDLYFRNSLGNIYGITGNPPPEEILSPVENLQKNERIPYISPVIDGRNTHFYEWSNAIEADPSAMWATFRPVGFPLEKIYYGYDEKNIFVRIDSKNAGDLRITISLGWPEERNFEITGGHGDGGIVYAAQEIIEIAIPRHLAGKDSGTVSFGIFVVTVDGRRFRIPSTENFRITFKDEENWIV